MKSASRKTLTMSELRTLVLEGQAPAQSQQQQPSANAQQGQEAAPEQQADPKTKGFLEKICNAFVTQLQKIGDPNTITQVLKAIVNSKSPIEAFQAIKGIKSQKDAEAKQEKEQQQQQGQGEQQQEQPQQAQAVAEDDLVDIEVDEGLWDRFVAKGNAWAQGAKAVGQNVGNAVKGAITGDKSAQHQSVSGAMQTGKFGQLIQQYIGKIETLKKTIADYAAKTQDKEEQQKCSTMVQQIDAFVKSGQDALKTAKDDLKKSGYDRQNAEKDGEQKGDEKQQGNQTQPNQNQQNNNGDSDKKADNGGNAQKKDAEQPKDQGNNNGEQQQDDNKDEQKQEVKESTKFTLTIAQLRKLVKECSVNEGFFDKVKGAVQSTGQTIKKAAVNTAQKTGQALNQWGKEIKQGTHNLVTTGDTRGAKSAARFAEELARIIGELEMDLKDCGWSADQNPQLGQVISNIEKSANEIHGKGEQGMTTTWDKIRHGIGKMVGTAISAAVQAAALNALLGPLKPFMSPRTHAALVAFCTVLLRWYLKNLGNQDINADKKAQKQAQAAQPAAQQANESMEIPQAVMERAMRKALMAYRKC